MAVTTDGLSFMKEPALQAIDFFFEFREKLDSLASIAWEQYGSQMQCQKGCSQCCRGDFHISIVEAHVLKQSILALSPEIKVQLQDNLKHFKPSQCPLLDATGACLVYDNRPILCRIFGFPIRIPAHHGQNEHIATCELNFKDSLNQEFQAQCFDKATIQDVLRQISGLLISETLSQASDTAELPTFTVTEVIEATLQQGS